MSNAEQTAAEIALAAKIEECRAQIADPATGDSLRAAAKSALISARIMLAKVGGMSTREAFDHVLGAGAYEAMARDLYHGLRAKAASARG